MLKNINMPHNVSFSLPAWQGTQNQIGTRQKMTQDLKTSNSLHIASMKKLPEITFMFELTAGLHISAQQRESC